MEQADVFKVNEKRRCFECGRYETQYTKMQKHHPLGHQFEDFTVDHCQDCHDDMTNCQQKGVPIKYRQKLSKAELYNFQIRSLADLLKNSADKLQQVIDREANQLSFPEPTKVDDPKKGV